MAASNSNIEKLRSEQVTSASLRLHSAQELSLLGHSLVDELSSLFGQLLSDHSQPDEPPTLLEDLEAMHRNLREQESVKAYVQVIHRALQLRCAQRFSRSSAISNPLASESAAAEISPGHPINVSKYHTLRGFVSAVKQGCSPPGSDAGEANVSLRLVSFLEETQRRTWLDMRAVLSKYTALLLNDYFFSNQSGLRCIVLCLPLQRTCIGRCQSTMLPRARNIEKLSRARFVVCLSFRQCKYYTSSPLAPSLSTSPQWREITFR
jgi:hypothetical protein